MDDEFTPVTLVLPAPDELRIALTAIRPELGLSSVDVRPQIEIKEDQDQGVNPIERFGWASRD